MRGCYFCQNNIEIIDYKSVDLLKNYLTSTGRILPAKATRTCAKHQRKLKKAIKRARILGLLPFMLR